MNNYQQNQMQVYFKEHLVKWDKDHLEEV